MLGGQPVRLLSNQTLTQLGRIFFIQTLSSSAASSNEKNNVIAEAYHGDCTLTQVCCEQVFAAEDVQPRRPSQRTQLRESWTNRDLSPSGRRERIAISRCGFYRLGYCPLPILQSSSCHICRSFWM